MCSAATSASASADAVGRDHAAATRLFGVQPENCAPIHAAFTAGAQDFVAVETRPTIAEGTSIAKPVRTRDVLAAIRRSGGATVTVTDDEIVAAMWELARGGIYAEPTSASAAAALSNLRRDGVIAPGRDHGGGPDRHRPEGDTADRGSCWRRQAQQP